MSHTTPSAILDLKAFVPATNAAISRQFYIDLGFKQLWAEEGIAEFEIGTFRFLLQTFYAKGHAENFMMHLMVADADAWWDHIQSIKLGEKYPGIMLKPPTMQPWGLRVLYLSDPTGILWHIADRKKG